MQDRKLRRYNRKNKKRKQQHINGTENLLLKTLQNYDQTRQKLFKIMTKSRLPNLTAIPQSILYVLEVCWHVTNDDFQRSN